MVEGGEGEARGRPWVGYAVAGVAILAATVVAIVLLTGDDGSSAPIGSGPVISRDAGPAERDLLPDGGLFATPEEGVGVKAAAEAAGCELKSFRVASRDHIPDLQASVRYTSIPPTSGKHYPVPAADGAYEQSPYLKTIVHSLEHSRVVLWFQPDLPTDARAAIKAFFDNDSELMLLVPDEHDMPYEVAATAWNRKPRPNGTGRLLGCPEYDDAVFTALEAFKKRHRGRGPEQLP